MLQGRSEVDYIYEQLKVLSGGLDSGQQRDTVIKVGARIDVVFWQKQLCKCALQSAITGGAVCARTGGCQDFLCVFNGML